jgi:hypothetical protein
VSLFYIAKEFEYFGVVVAWYVVENFRNRRAAGQLRQKKMRLKTLFRENIKQILSSFA